MDLILGIIAVAFILATILPAWKHEAWWVRVFDFPRAQIAAGGLLVTATYVVIYDVTTRSEAALVAALVGCVAYQMSKMLPYTRLYPRQVKSAAGSASSSLSFMIANVFMDNREADRFLQMVRECRPDVVLTVETDAWWVEHLSELDRTHPFTVKVPLSNTYGMQLHSRLELIESQVLYLVDKSIPSIHARLKLPSGIPVRLYCLHPRPPAPTEDTDTIRRDAELLLVGREARAVEAPTVVMGDLNDVAWSYTTKLFQRISGLLDPRVGRGMFSTFHARYPLVRWPLDHLFHSDHFKVARIERLPAWGSDHFPIFVELQYAADGPDVHETPTADPEDQKEAREKINRVHDD